MPRRSSKPRLPDPNTLAFNIVQQITGEPPLSEPEPDAKPAKNPHAVAMGKLGGAKGGAARAKSLSKKQRSEIAKKAAAARWNRQKPT
jgi:hypothetical protein